MISYIFSFEIINLFLHDPKFFFWIAASVADAATVNITKRLLVNGFSLMKSQFLVMAVKVYLEILLTVLFYADVSFDSSIKKKYIGFSFPYLFKFPV